jgi:prolyl-tRNA synthetase
VLYSNAYIPTRKEDPADAEVVSHKLLIRAGFIRQVAAGIYSFLPLGWRVVRKVEEIVREEMNRAGALEVLLPGVQPAALWEQSGRWAHYGPELLRFVDRKGNDYCLGPTHEEVITDLVRDEVRSYKQLPLNLYQIQAKFRDEVRPRAGLMRGREFIMKDSYSFDADEAGARRSYDLMYDAYHRIFRRCGLRFRPVEADTGNIGGSGSHEFQVLADSGEDAITSCPSCGYTANVEMAEIQAPAERADTGFAERARVETPGAKTVEQVTAFLKVGPESLVKTLIYIGDGATYAVLARGDAEINEIKVKHALGVDELVLAGEDVVENLTGAAVGFAGPVGLGVKIVADNGVRAMRDFVVGANADDAHYTGVNWGRDFSVDVWADLRVAGGGDACGRCGAAFEAYRGIEVGQVFYLGTKYSAAMGATFLDAEGKAKPFVMGCYGIGVTRVVSAAIEQNHDDAGIVWPMALAPFHVVILAMQPKSAEVMAAARTLHDSLGARGVDVLLDDRDERPGFKFKDADLVGYPLRLVVGERGLKDGVVELKRRNAEGVELVAVDAVVEQIVALVNAELGDGE